MFPFDSTDMTQKRYPLNREQEASTLPCIFHIQPRSSERWGWQINTSSDSGAYIGDYTVTSPFTSPFQLLPDEIALYLFSYLQFPDLICLRAVSRRWKNLAQDQSLWPRLELSFSGGYTGLAAYIHSKKADCALKTPEKITSYSIPSKTPVNYLEMSGNALISMNEPGKIWNLESGQLQSTFTYQPSLRSKILVGKQIIAANEYGQNEVIATETGQALYSFQTKRRVSSFAAHPDHFNQLYMGLTDGTLALWDLNLKRQTASFKAHEREISSLALTKTFLISGSVDGVIKVWHPLNHQLVSTLAGHESAISSLASDEDTLISGDVNGEIKMWSLKALKCMKKFKAHYCKVSKLAIAGNKLISGGWDGKIKVWDLDTLQLMANLQNPGNLIKDIAVTNDKILSCAEWNSFAIWDLSQDIENLAL